MVYRVVLADSAKEDADAIYRWVVEAAPYRGPLWFEGLMSSLESLHRMPYRYPVAREVRRTKAKTRCMLYGKGRNVYRILYLVDERLQTVWILHIRNGARQDMEPREISASEE